MFFDFLERILEKSLAKKYGFRDGWNFQWTGRKYIENNYQNEKLKYSEIQRRIKEP